MKSPTLLALAVFNALMTLNPPHAALPDFVGAVLTGLCVFVALVP